MLRKVVIVLAVAGVLVLAVIAAQRAGFLGSRLGGPEPDAEQRWQLAEIEAEVERKLAPVRSGDGRAVVVLDAADLRRLLISELARREDGRRLLAVARDFETEIVDGRVRMGVTVNPSRIPEEGLSEEVRDFVRNIRRLLVLFGDSDVYFGVNGTPAAAAGGIAFDRDTRVTLAFLDMSLADFADRAGLEDEIDERLRFDLPGVRVAEIEVLEAAVRIATEPPAGG